MQSRAVITRFGMKHTYPRTCAVKKKNNQQSQPHDVSRRRSSDVLQIFKFRVPLTSKVAFFQTVRKARSNESNQYYSVSYPYAQVAHVGGFSRLSTSFSLSLLSQRHPPTIPDRIRLPVWGRFDISIAVKPSEIIRCERRLRT
jgi:hypothetical protein